MANQKLNGVLINWYDASDGDYIGPHSDDESTLEEGAPIVSITYCSNDEHYRRFRFRPKKGHDGKTEIVKLRNGDVLTMGGTCQKTHKHEIMPARKADALENTGRRINVTLRRFKDSTIAPNEEKKKRKAVQLFPPRRQKLKPRSMTYGKINGVAPRDDAWIESDDDVTVKPFPDDPYI
jgi:hypothetical protein